MDAEAVHRAWLDRSAEYSPGYYAYYGPDDISERLRTRLDSVVGPDATVLELGCSSGRHLAHLHEHGYTDLWGIEINADARRVMRETYPELAASGTFHFDAIEAVLPDFGVETFDAVFSVETLQHIHHDNAWVFREVARVTGDVLVTVENEGHGEGDGECEGDGGGDGEGVAGDGRGDGDPAPSATDARGPSGDAAVSYVDGAFPLYYRDWNRIFTGHGFREVDCESIDRDILRVFRRDDR